MKKVLFILIFSVFLGSTFSTAYAHGPKHGGHSKHKVVKKHHYKHGHKHVTVIKHGHKKHKRPPVVVVKHRRPAPYFVVKF